MVTKPLFVEPNSLHPSPHCDACVGWGNSTVYQQTHKISPLIGGNHFSGKTPPNSSRCCQNLRGIHHDSFSDTYPAFPALNLWLVYVSALILDPFYHIAHARECRMLIDTTVRILLSSPTTPRALRTCSPDPFFCLLSRQLEPRDKPLDELSIELVKRWLAMLKGS